MQATRPDSHLPSACLEITARCTLGTPATMTLGSACSSVCTWNSIGGAREPQLTGLTTTSRSVSALQACKSFA